MATLNINEMCKHNNKKTKPILATEFKKQLGNSHDMVSCMFYWIYLIVCERAMLCCIVYFVFQMYFFGFQTIWYHEINTIFTLSYKDQGKAGIWVSKSSVSLMWRRGAFEDSNRFVEQLSSNCYCLYKE